MRAFCRSIAVLILFFASTTGLAQSVSGSVRDGATGSPVPGAVVGLMQPSGERLTATLTDSAGRYRLRAPAAGTFTLRVDVIGYRSTQVPGVVIEGSGAVTRDVVFRFERTQLPAIAVTASSACASVGSEAGDAPRLWAEARKALEAAQLAIAEQRFTVALRRYERTIALPDSVLRDSRTWTQTGVTRNPFETLPPDVIARDGFAVQRDTAQYYYAPDAGVLLSDAFVSGHCFGTRRGGPGGALGLTFRPQRNAGRVDISGVLWIDSAAAELRALEYRYVANGRQQDGGGTVNFGRYPSGVWGVQRWSIRLPVLHVTESRRRPDGAVGRHVDTIMVALREAGGEVVATGASAPGAASTATRLSGVVFDSTLGTPLAGATVTIEGLGLTAVTDSAGRFAFDSIADEGDVRVRTWHARLDSLGFAAPVTPVRLRRRVESTANVNIPGIAEVGRVRCASSARNPSRIVMGAVRSGPGAAPPAASTEVVLLERVPVTGSARDSLVRHAEYSSDAGRYAFCGVQPASLGWLVVRGSSGWSDPRVVTAASGPVELVPLTVPPVDSSVVEALTQMGAPLMVLGRTVDPTRPSRVSGWVLLPDDVTGRIQVLVDDVVRATAASDGTFHLDDMGAGARRLSFRVPGLAVRHVALTVEAGQTQLLLVTLTRAPVVAVQPKVLPLDTRQADFERRRKAGGGGYFIDRAEIERRNPRTFTDLMRSVPGVRVVANGGGFRYVSTHFRTLFTVTGDGTCDMSMYLDGQPFPMDVPDADARIGISEIKGVEVYVSASSVPRQFVTANAACGVIAVWR